MLKAVQAVVVAVTRLHIILFLFLCMYNTHAAVVPEDRADFMFHSYDGGGVSIDGPSIIVRKGNKKNFSVYGQYYVDNISSASIDVEVSGASRYSESRTEHSLGVDYVRDKTVMSFSHTISKENDFEATSSHIGVSQDMFGDLTTITLGYSQGSDIIGDSTNPSFEEKATRKNFRLGITQVLTKDLIMSYSHETISDQGFLNNPYRFIRYVVDPNAAVLTYALDKEIYPTTRTSTANAIRAKYYLPYDAALHFEYRVFEDDWGINADIIEFGYTHPFEDNWIFDIHYRFYSQSQANFYRDLFPYQNSHNFMARDKELSSYTDTTFGVGVSYEFAKNGLGFIDKGSVNLLIDNIRFDYDNFRDLRATGYAVGEEPLYNLDANVIRLFCSIWY